MFTPMPSVGLGQDTAATGGKRAKAVNDALIPFTQLAKSEILDPVERKTGGLVFHVPPAEIQAAMLPVCGSGPSLTGDVGTFLGVTHCWLEEAFGHWIVFEQVGLQAIGIGDALNSAAAQTEARAKKPPITSGVMAAAAESARKARVLAAKFIQMGQKMARTAQTQKETVRGMRRLSPDIRDALILFNDAIDTGEISTQDPAIADVKAGLQEVVTGWRRMVVQQIDLALYAAKYAQKIVDVNQRLLLAQFNLALMGPELFAIADGLIKIVDGLLEDIKIFSWPGRALEGLAALPGMVVGGVTKALTDPATKALTQTAWVVAGLAVVGVSGAILLKKYGVIGKLKGD